MMDLALCFCFTGQNKSNQYLLCEERLPQPGLQRLSAAVSHTVPVQLTALHATHIQPPAAVSLRHCPSHLDSISNSILRDSSGEAELLLKSNSERFKVHLNLPITCKRYVKLRSINKFMFSVYRRHLFLTAASSMGLAQRHTTKLVQILSTSDVLSTETGLSFSAFLKS